MLMALKRGFARVLCIVGLAATSSLAAAPALAQKAPLKVGFSMALTGGLAGNGKAALMTIQMWADEVNARGGLLGRKVDLVYYDDQSTPSSIPGLYTKLIEVDKVDIVVSPYGTNLIAPAMPVVMQSGKTMMSLFGVGVNYQFRYDRYFQIMPLGEKADEAIGAAFLDVAQKLPAKPKTIAIVGADAEFGKVTTDAMRSLAKAAGLKVVYDRSYPPNTVEFASVVRAIQATSPDLVFLGAYPPDSVGMIRAANEVGLKTQLFGGAMAGPQFASIKTQLGPGINNVVGYELYVPSSTLKFPGIENFLTKYRDKAAAAGVDPLGFYVPPFVYAAMQIVGDAVEKTGGTDQKAMADYMHKTTFSTIVGDVRFGPLGEWETPRVLLVQYRGIEGKDLDQFRKPEAQVILYPPQYATGTPVAPFRN